MFAQFQKRARDANGLWYALGLVGLVWLLVMIFGPIGRGLEDALTGATVAVIASEAVRAAIRIAREK